MFRQAETIILFSATAVQAAVFSYILQENLGLDTIIAVPLGLILGFAFSCFELAICSRILK